MARSSIGTGYRPFKAERCVQFPYGLLTSERSEVWLSRQFRELEIVGSIPTVLTEKYRWADVGVRGWLLTAYEETLRRFDSCCRC